MGETNNMINNFTKIQVTATFEEDGWVPVSVTPHLMNVVSYSGSFTQCYPLSSGLSLHQI